MRSPHAFMMSYNILSSMLTACMLLAPLHDCMGEVDGAKQRKAKTAQNQSASRLTPLDLSRITFNDDISYLSPAEQERYRNCQAEFSKSLKQLPSKQRKELQEAYKWVPDVVKIIASRDYQDRKEYKNFIGSELYSYTKHELYKKYIGKNQKYHIPEVCSMSLIYAER